MAQHPLPVNFDVHAEGPPLKAWQDFVDVVHEILRQHRGETRENLTATTTTTTATTTITTIPTCTRHSHRGSGKGRDPRGIKSELSGQGCNHIYSNRQTIDRPDRLSLQNLPSNSERRRHRRRTTSAWASIRCCPKSGRSADKHITP